jgi:AraC-like DNA-binding protein
LTAHAIRLTIHAKLLEGHWQPVMKQKTSHAASFTVSADLIRGLIDCAVQCGIQRERLSDMIGGESTAERKSSTPVRYAGDHTVKLWERILRLTGDPIVGFRMAFFAGPKTFGALGLILPRCLNVLDALRQTERYSALASDGARIWVTVSAQTITVHLTVQDLGRPDVQRAVTLWGLTNLCLMPQRLTQTAFSPKLVIGNCEAPGSSALRALREHLPIRFEPGESQIVFDRRVGEIAIPSADRDLQLLLTETMDRHLEALGPARSFEQGMLVLLRGMMNGTMPTLASLSASAGMSQRTLQRRLNEANTSFQRLLNQVLQEEADQLLARGNLSQGEIAFLLGYSEVSAFSRAYRSWTGHPPGEIAVRQM